MGTLLSPVREERVPNSSKELWGLVRRQHGVISRSQLLAAGLSDKAIFHRVATGRLHRWHTGVYAVGRRELSRLGELMSAVLACGEGAVLSHESAAELWRIGSRRRRIDITVPRARRPAVPGIRIHRRPIPAEDIALYRAVPVTTPACTLVDLAGRLSAEQAERAVNEADRLDLIDPEALRAKLEGMPGRPGVPALRKLLDRRTFTLTASQLERRFKPIAKAAGLPLPQTGVHLNGHEVDFYWPELGLVVETDGLRYHRTPSQQARALKRDQAHFASGLTPLRFSHAQVVYEPEDVRNALEDTAQRLTAKRSAPVLRRRP